MANGLMALVGGSALYLVCAGCSAEHDSDSSSSAGRPAASGGATASGGAPGAAGATALGGASALGGATASGVAGATGGGGKPSGSPPPPISGRSIYALECHGDSKDCNLATVPCFGVSTQTQNVAAGWACANRCASDADCSDAPSGAEARASCVPFTSASHCMLVCQNENQSFACPDGMICHVPPKSPIGYCLWQ